MCYQKNKTKLNKTKTPIPLILELIFVVPPHEVIQLSDFSGGTEPVSVDKKV